ncbi:CASC3/Barentsz eIF4AIII binding [Zea mays]|nr:CASC3/Barentsz eIF4AIII binding [Zea mays]
MADPPASDAQPEQAPAAAAASNDPAEDATVEKPLAAPPTPKLDAAAAADGSAYEVEDDEYVSDPNDEPFPTMRRREASDDEGSEDGRPRARIGPDQDDDGQGGPEAYDDEVDEEDEEYYDEEEEDLGEGFEEYEGRAAPPMEDGGGGGGGQVSRGEDGVAGEEGLPEGEAKGEGEEKEQEPFAVPTSGAFYMHDDRFQEENRGRRRRMFGARKLWDAKDDQAWVHDRFEEMNLHDDRYEDQRMSRGRFRGRGGRGKARGGGRGFPRGGKQPNYHEDGNTQNRPPKVVRGRGPRRYEAVARSSREVVGSQRKQAARFREPVPNAAAARNSGQVSHAQQEAAPPKKNVISSSLNSASPPFYPSGAACQDFPVATQRRDIQTGGSNKIPPSSMKMDDNSILQSGSMVRGRTAMDYGGRDRFHADGPVRSSLGRVPTASLNSGFTSSLVNPSQSTIVRASGGNSNIGISSNNQPTSSLHQTSRISTHPQSHGPVMHQKSMQVQNQSAARIPTQQLSHRTNNSLPAAQHLSVKSTESGENGSYPSLNNSKTASAVVKANSQETGMDSLMYGGAQVIGAAGLSQGDQNFPGTPALLPVMQFGGQHPGGLGVPTVGMALPGYVSQQQMGMGNNEMAWLPLLAGAAGAFGASYPPYITLDPSFYSRSPGQTSSSVPSR